MAYFPLLHSPHSQIPPAACCYLTRIFPRLHLSAAFPALCFLHFLNTAIPGSFLFLAYVSMNSLSLQLCFQGYLFGDKFRITCQIEQMVSWGSIG